MKAKLCYDGRTCRNEILVEDLIDVLEIASTALRQYQNGKTWPHIATDALEEIGKVVGKNDEKQARVVDAVLRERAYQDDEWGVPWYNDHPVSAWLLILERELSEAKEAWVTEEGDQAALLEILQVAAVAFACLEQHGIVEREPTR